MPKLTDEYLGKYAVANYGFHSGLVGKIERSSFGVSPYCLRFASGGGQGVSHTDDITLWDEYPNELKRKGTDK